jgi:hypothetical protein
MDIDFQTKQLGANRDPKETKRKRKKSRTIKILIMGTQIFFHGGKIVIRCNNKECKCDKRKLVTNFVIR